MSHKRTGISHPFILQLVPLGGVGEIGHNMVTIKTPHQWILIDAGILFPDHDFLGVNYLIPNLDAINQSLLTDIIITHGHEDHIGAIAHLIVHCPNIKIWAPHFAAALIRRKLQEKGLNPLINIYTESSVFNFSGIVIHPIHVNHSIPDTFGLLIQDSEAALSCFYVSDFKYDENSPYEAPMNLAKLKKLSANSWLRYLLVDSTNILNKGKTPSEADLIPHFQEIIEGAKGRIFITFFPSNIHRLQTILSLAYKQKKRVVYLGRSTKFYSELAYSMGLLKFYNETLVDEKSLTEKEEDLIILLSGCQGDFKGALRKIVFQEHPVLHLQEKDLVLFSSRAIPGNEIQIINIYNKICEQGAKVINPDDALIHSSGHPGQEDLKILFKHYSPTHFSPIHGETYFLHKHIHFIQKTFPEIKGHLIKNYDVLSISPDLEVIISPQEILEPIFIHGNDIPIEKAALRKRRKMGSQGVIYLSLREDNPRAIKIEFMGLPSFIEDHKEKLKEFLFSYLQIHLKNKDSLTKENELKIQVRKFFFPMLGYKPITIIHIP